MLRIVTGVSQAPWWQAGAEICWQLLSVRRRQPRGMAYLLCSPLVGSLVLVVNSAEVGNNDWNGQSNDQHPAQGANGAKYLPSNGLGHHVTITRGGGKKKKEGKPLLQTSAPKAFSGSLSAQQRECPDWTLKLRNPPCKQQFMWCCHPRDSNYTTLWQWIKLSQRKALLLQNRCASSGSCWAR